MANASTKLFKWYFTTIVAGVTNYYYVDAAGAVQLTTVKTPIRFAPKGWRSQLLRWERGFVYFGVFQTYTEPLKFVKDGAKILKHLYKTYGTEPACNLYIEKFNKTASIWAYQPYYNGEFDFSRYLREKDFVNNEIMEGGFLAKLKAKETTDFDIDVMNNPNRVWVNFDGIMLMALFQFTGMEQPVDNSPPTYVASYRENFPTLLWYQTEGYSNGDNNPKGNDAVGPNATMFQQTYANADMITLSSADKWILRNSSNAISYDYHIKGSMEIDHQNTVMTGTRKMTVYLYKNAGGAVGTNVTKYTLVTGGVIPAGGSLSEKVDFDFQITLAPDEQIWIWFRHSGVPGEVKYHLRKCDVNVFVPNRTRQSFAPVLRSVDVGEALIAKINSTTAFQSTILGVTNKNKTLTSGDALRGLANATIKTNISDYHKSTNAMCNTCLIYDRVSDTVSINPKAFAFDDSTQIMDLGEVSKLKHYPATQEMFAKYLAGYRDIKYDEINGKDEPNVSFQYQSALTRVTAEKDMRSDYRADMTGIELTRSNLTGKILADSASDNDVFWVDIEPTPAGTIPAGLPGAGENYYNLQRSGYTVIQGLTFPATAYNLYLSPKLRVIEHGNYINSVLWPQMLLPINLPTGILKFESASKSQDNGQYLVWDISGFGVDERAFVPLSTLADPLFYPIILEFESLIPQNILSILNTNPYGKVRILDKGKELFGFLLEVQDEPVTRPKQIYKLLCSPSTNLDNLS